MTATAQYRGSPPGDGRQLVLIVDDEQAIADLVATAVSQAGHTPVLAYHGRQALEKARDSWPALVITDLMMPFMDGVTFIAALRREAVERGKQAPPIIVMTAAGHPSAASAGADAVLSKPFELTELDAMVGEYITSGS